MYKLKKRAWKRNIVFLSQYRELMERAGIESLKERRIKAMKKMAEKWEKSDIFKVWFPNREQGT